MENDKKQSSTASRDRVVAISRNLDAHLASRFGNETPQTIFVAASLTALNIVYDLQVSRKDFMRVMRDMYDEFNRHDPYVQGEVACTRGHTWSDRIYKKEPVLRSKCPQCKRRATHVTYNPED